MKLMWQALKMFLWMTLLTGILYPMLITEIAQLTMKQKADGDFILRDGKRVGSALIAQKFQSDKYFWPRPSAVDYNPLPSGGSNLGPTSKKLKQLVQERKEIVLKAHHLPPEAAVPSELLFASGSGLDPHISPATAIFQLDRVLKARNADAELKKTLEDLIVKNTEKPFLGFIGEPCVNVLKLNLALDEWEASIR